MYLTFILYRCVSLIAACNLTHLFHIGVPLIAACTLTHLFHIGVPLIATCTVTHLFLTGVPSSNVDPWKLTLEKYVSDIRLANLIVFTFLVGAK